MQRLFVGVLTILMLVLFTACHRSGSKRYVHDEADTNEQPDNCITIIGQPDIEVEHDSAVIVSDDSILLVKTSKSISSTILKRVAYITSYNTKTRNPNWVAWHLTSEHTEGPYNRKGVPYYNDNGDAIGIASFTYDVVYGDYFVDREVSSPRQEHSDWKEHPSNIDHGHMCPAADCKWSKEAINQSFLLTNMCPQDHELNGGDWETLEDKCRKWAKKYGDIYIVAGPIFYNGIKKTFGANRIAIPDAFFKVVLCTKGTPKALGFIYSNNAEKQPMNQTVCSVDEVERVTNIDFFSSLPDEVEETVESNYNLRMW